MREETMSVRLAEFIRTVEARIPGILVEVRPHSSEDDPEITNFVFLLHVPVDRLRAVEDEVLDLAAAAFPDGPIPFLLSAVSPENSRRYFPEAAVGEAAWLLASCSPTSVRPRGESASSILLGEFVSGGRNFPINMDCASKYRGPRPEVRRADTVNARPASDSTVVKLPAAA